MKAVRPARDAIEIRFPRVAGYRVELPEERLTAAFTDDSRTLGRRAFTELTEIYRIESAFEAKVASAFNEMIARAGGVTPAFSA